MRSKPKTRAPSDTFNRHPDVVVTLSDLERNVDSLIGKVAKAIRTAGHSEDAIAFAAAARASGSYAEVLSFAKSTVTIQ